MIIMCDLAGGHTKPTGNTQVIRRFRSKIHRQFSVRHLTTLPIIGIGADVADLYSQTELAAKGYSTDAKLKTIEIPVNLKWSFGLGSMLGAYIAAGPQFGFNIGNKKGFMNYDLKKNNTSFNVGAGVKLIRHLQLGVNYNFALGHTATLYADPNIILDGKPLTQDVKIKNNTWQVSLAYLF